MDELNHEKKTLDNLFKQLSQLKRTKSPEAKVVEVKIRAQKARVEKLQREYNSKQRAMKAVQCLPGHVNVNSVCKPPCPPGLIMDPLGACKPMTCPVGFTMTNGKCNPSGVAKESGTGQVADNTARRATEADAALRAADEAAARRTVVEELKHIVAEAVNVQVAVTATGQVPGQDWIEGARAALDSAIIRTIDEFIERYKWTMAPGAPDLKLQEPLKPVEPIVCPEFSTLVDGVCRATAIPDLKLHDNTAVIPESCLQFSDKATCNSMRDCMWSANNFCTRRNF